MKNLLLCKVFMLPTEKPTNLFVRPAPRDTTELFNSVGENCARPQTGHSINSSCVGQFLYFTSNREIKADNWYLFLKNNTVCKATSDKENLKTLEELRKGGHVVKIEASTDTDLRHTFGVKEGGCGAIGDSFIEVYTKTKGTIKEVNLELISNGDWIFERSSGYAGDRCRRCATWIYANQQEECNCGHTIKTRNDNSVVIHATKKYTAEEVGREVREKIKLLMKEPFMTFTKDVGIKGWDLLDKWMDENT